MGHLMTKVTNNSGDQENALGGGAYVAEGQP